MNQFLEFHLSLSDWRFDLSGDRFHCTSHLINSYLLRDLYLDHSFISWLVVMGCLWFPKGRWMVLAEQLLMLLAWSISRSCHLQVISRFRYSPRPCSLCEPEYLRRVIRLQLGNRSRIPDNTIIVIPSSLTHWGERNHKDFKEFST